jgi:hypothetical protein
MYIQQSRQSVLGFAPPACWYDQEPSATCIASALDVKRDETGIAYGKIVLSTALVIGTKTASFKTQSARRHATKGRKKGRSRYVVTLTRHNIGKRGTTI